MISGIKFIYYFSLIILSQKSGAASVKGNDTTPEREELTSIF